MPLKTVWLPGPLRVDVELTGADVGGAFCLLVDHPLPGWSLPPHHHQNESETIYVLDGRFEVIVAGHRKELTAGEVAHVPKGVEHSGRALGDHPGRRLLVFAPAGIEDFFLAAGTATPDEDIEADRLSALAVEHGWRFRVSP